MLMVQILKGKPGLGAAFGTGLSHSLNALAEAKVKQLIEAPNQQRFSEIMSAIQGRQQQPQQQGNLTPQEQQLAGQAQPQQAQAQGLDPAIIDAIGTLPINLQIPAFNALQKQSELNSAERRYQDTQKFKIADHNNKIVGKPLSELRDRAEAADRDTEIWNRILELADTGNLRTGPLAQLLERAGFAGFGANVDTQEAQALMSELAQGAASVYPRLNKAEFNAYKDGLARSWNTREGLKRLGRNQINKNKAIKARYNALNDYVDKNQNSLLPLNAVDIGLKGASSQLEKLTDRFIKQNNLPREEQQEVAPQQALQQQVPPNQGAGGGNIASDLLRGGLRTGARALEQIGGIPGDIASAVLGVGNYLSGGAIPSYEDVQKKLPTPPTTAQNREALKKLTKGYLEPQGPVESFIDDVAGDVAGLAAGSSTPLKNVLFKAVTGNAASGLVKSLGGGPTAQAATKLGVMMLGSLPGGKKALIDQKEVLYKEAEELAQGNSASVTKPHKVAKDIFDKLTVSDTPHSPEVVKRAEHIANLTKDVETLPLIKIWEAKKDLNKWISHASTDSGAIPYYKRMVGALNEAIQESGNKEFLNVFNRAEDIATGLLKGSETTKFLKENLNKDSLKWPLISWLARGTQSAYKLAKNQLAGVTAEQAHNVSSFWDLISNSKEARNHYIKLLAAGAAHDVAAANKEAQLLGKIYEHEA
jgi:hypothetical protein